MKKIFILTALFAVLISSAQENQVTKEYNLTKSKNQKTIGWILAAGGAGLIIAGIAVDDNDHNNDPNELDFGPNYDVGPWLIGGGVVCGLASIPFFISAGKNAQKGASIGFAGQKILLPQGNFMVGKMQPSISAIINF